jgi:iron complex transport system substrate-binding protein
LYVEKSYSGIVLKDVGFPRPEGQPTKQDAIAVDVSQERIGELDADVAKFFAVDSAKTVS